MILKPTSSSKLPPSPEPVQSQVFPWQQPGCQEGGGGGYFGSRGQRVPQHREGVRKGESSTKAALGMKAQARGFWSTRALVQSPALMSERKWSPVISAALQSRSMQAIEKCCIKGPLFSLDTETSEKGCPGCLRDIRGSPLPTAAFITNLQLIILILILPEHF